jgi:hypothetical protein
MSKNLLIGTVIAFVGAVSAALGVAYADQVLTSGELVQALVAGVTAAIAYVKKPAA